MEDGCVGGFVQRGIAGASPDQEAVLEMGGARGREQREPRSRKPSVADFGKRIAAIWACEGGWASMSNNLYQMIALSSPRAEYAAMHRR